jgi:subtilisin family serine protease
MKIDVPLGLMAIVLACTARSQVRLPSLPAVGLPLQGVQQTLAGTAALDPLNDLRQVQITRLIRANRRLIDTDPKGETVVRNEVLALLPSQSAVQNALARGYEVEREQRILNFDIHLVVFRAPAGMSTAQALRALRQADPGGNYDYNHIYSSSGLVDGADVPAAVPIAAAAPAAAAASRRIGLVDSGIDDSHPVFREASIHAWGCDSHPLAAAHGTAVASILIGHAEGFQGARPDAALYAADVYCGRPTGGAVDALIAALGWLVEQRVPIINISLVGPKNATLESVLAHLTGAGFLVVAAVGNDGPAAAPLYPASYPGVIGVTAVDAHRHVLIEAAHGPQVMFAAPGADMAAASMGHGFEAVRGTSFAAPIVAALLAEQYFEPSVEGAKQALGALARTAVDIGPTGRDLTYGYGLVGETYRNDPGLLNHR